MQHILKLVVCLENIRAIPEKKIPGEGRGYIILWVVSVDRFQIIWVIGVRPNQITWVVGILLRGREEKILSAKKREKFYQKSSQNKALSCGNGGFCFHAIVKPLMFPSNIGKKQYRNKLPNELQSKRPQVKTSPNWSNVPKNWSKRPHG